MLAPAVQPIRILLVDDHRSVLWGLEKLIDSAGPSMQVIGKATRCAEALAAVDEYQPDVVLLDAALENENGLDLLRALRGRRAPKVLILTGVRDPEMRERAMLWGARGVVYKLESAETILKAIAHVHTGELWLDRATLAKVFASTLGAGNDGEGTGPASRDAALTATERRIIASVVRHKGAPRKVVADALHISSHTLRNHLASIYSKLGVHTRLDLFLYAKEHGLDQHTA
jgi:two-component system, NarL family, nitrate/nitrite response regulator NarL